MSKLKYRYKLEKDYLLRHQYLNGLKFKSEWIEIKDGILLIKTGYAWDGCVPKWKFKLFGRVFWFGMPDGDFTETGERVTRYPSLVFDALCQHREEIAFLTRENIVDIYYSLLMENGFPELKATVYGFVIEHLLPKSYCSKEKRVA